MRVTQVRESMEGKKILERVSEIKREKEKKEAAKKREKQETQNRVSMFHQFKKGCSATKPLVKQKACKNAQDATTYCVLSAAG